MFLHSNRIHYFVIVFFGIADYNFASSSNESEREFSTLLQTTESTRNVLNFSLNPQLGPLKLATIEYLFGQQYTLDEQENRWKTLAESPKSPQWSDLCYQTWHFRDHPNFRKHNCKATAMIRKPYSPFSVLICKIKLKADLLKCECPYVPNKRKRPTLINYNHNFGLIRHNNSYYFSLIAVSKHNWIIHGFITDFQPPFNTTLDISKRHYFTNEAIASYHDVIRSCND